MIKLKKLLNKNSKGNILKGYLPLIEKLIEDNRRNFRTHKDYRGIEDEGEIDQNYLRFMWGKYYDEPSKQQDDIYKLQDLIDKIKSKLPNDLKVNTEYGDKYNYIIFSIK